jgi:hypothetical protein
MAAIGGLYSITSQLHACIDSFRIEVNWLHRPTGERYVKEERLLLV